MEVGNSWRIKLYLSDIRRWHSSLIARKRADDAYRSLGGMCRHVTSLLVFPQAAFIRCKQHLSTAGFGLPTVHLTSQKYLSR